MNAPFYYQGMGGGGMNGYSQTGGGPGVGFSTSASIGGDSGSGTGVALLAILGGLVLLYVATRSIQGSR